MALDTVKKHTVWVADRGGKRRITTLTDAVLVRWTRVRDDISEATVYVHVDTDTDDATIKSLNLIEPGRHELVIFRGDDRVWEGPITLMAYGRGSVEIHAKDVMHYCTRTVMHAGYSSAYPNVEFTTQRAKRVLVNELARKEAIAPAINVVPHIVEHTTPTGAQTTRVTAPYELTVFEHLDDMAAKAGMDYTVVGRAIHLWDVDEHAMGTTRTVTEVDFLGDVYVSVYGSELATSYIVTDGQGGIGTAGGVDAFYGEVELLATAYDEEKDEEIPSTAELTSQAVRNLSGRNPTPLMVRVPDNSSLNPEGTLTTDDLVPGVHVPLLAQFGIRKVSQLQKLDKVSFEESPDGEKIVVTFVPATASDVPPEED